MAFTVMRPAGAALLLMAGVSDCGRDWGSEEVVAACSKDQMDDSNKECCPTALRYSHPRVKMSAKGCDCYCGMAEERECWNPTNDSDIVTFTNADGVTTQCCSRELAMGPHRRLVSEISQCNCWCGKGEQSGESLLGPNSWTYKLGLRTLASITEAEGRTDGRDGDVAASLNAVGNFKKRVGRRNATVNTDAEKFKEERDRILQNSVQSEAAFMGHKPTDEERGWLKQVIQEYYEKKKKGNASDTLPDFSEFVGPELMSLYMDKARAAMLSERDVREQSDKVVEKLIDLHTNFRRKELAWDDRQRSFNELLGHAENYMKHHAEYQAGRDGRNEDYLYSGQTEMRPVTDEPGRGWSKMEKLPGVAIAPGQPLYNKKFMWPHQQKRAETNGIFEADDDNALVQSLQSNARPPTVLQAGKTVSTPCEISRIDMERVEIKWRDPEDSAVIKLRGRFDGYGHIVGTGFKNDESQGGFTLKAQQAPECGSKTWSTTPVPQYCCPESMLGVEKRWFVTKPEGCDCYCGKFGEKI